MSASAMRGHVCRSGMPTHQRKVRCGRLFFIEVGGSNGHTWDAGAIYSSAAGQSSLSSMRGVTFDATVHRFAGRHRSNRHYRMALHHLRGGARSGDLEESLWPTAEFVVWHEGAKVQSACDGPSRASRVKTGTRSGRCGERQTVFPERFTHRAVVDECCRGRSEPCGSSSPEGQGSSVMRWLRS